MQVTPTSAQPSAPGTPIRFFDFLLPQRLLERSGADENPLVIRSRRRLRRLPRFLLSLLFQGLLVFLGAVALSQSGSLSSFPVLLFPLLAFFLLRYHLFINDQSHHTKSLDPRQLEHLILTNLTRDDYFLHHFLLFCLRYRVLVGWAILSAIYIASTILSGEWIWITADFYRPVFSLLALVLITWVCGVAQYVLEWRWFAGGRWYQVQRLVSLAISILIAAVIGVTIDLAFVFVHPFGIGLLSVAVFFVAAWMVFQSGLSVYANADVVLWQPFIARDPDWKTLVPTRTPGFLKLLRMVFVPWGMRSTSVNFPPAPRPPARVSPVEWTQLALNTVTHAVLLIFLYFLTQYIVQDLITGSRFRAFFTLAEYWRGTRIRLALHFLFAAAAIAFAGRVQLSLQRRESIEVYPFLLRHAKRVAAAALILAVVTNATGIVVNWRRSIPLPDIASYGAIRVATTYVESLVLWLIVLTASLWAVPRGPRTRSSASIAARNVARTLACGLAIPAATRYSSHVLLLSAAYILSPLWPRILSGRVSIFLSPIPIFLLALLAIPFLQKRLADFSYKRIA